MKNRILLVKSGYIAKEYLVLLKNMKQGAIVVGRGKENLELLKS
jgi:hypothetical protein